MEEHKALKYRDYRDKLYMIIGTENVDDTHPYINDRLNVLRIHTFVHTCTIHITTSQHIPILDLRVS